MPLSTLRELTPQSADTDDPVVRPPNNALVNPVVLPAALANTPARCPRHCPHSSWPPYLSSTAYHTDDKHYTQRDSLSPSYYSSSWVSHELPHQAHRLFPGDPAGALEQDFEESIKSGGSLLPHLRHDVSFMPNYPLRSTQSSLGRNWGTGSAILAAGDTNYPPIAFSSGLRCGFQVSRLPDSRNVHQMMDGWEQWTGTCNISSTTISVSYPTRSWYSHSDSAGCSTGNSKKASSRRIRSYSSLAATTGGAVSIIAHHLCLLWALNRLSIVTISDLDVIQLTFHRPVFTVPSRRKCTWDSLLSFVFPFLCSSVSYDVCVFVPLCLFSCSRCYLVRRLVKGSLTVILAHRRPRYVVCHAPTTAVHPLSST